MTLEGEQTDLKKYVEDAGGIHGLREVHKVRGWNNIQYGAGLSAKNTPSTKLSMNKELVKDAIQEVFLDLYLKREKNKTNPENLKYYLILSLKRNLIKKLKN